MVSVPAAPVGSTGVLSPVTYAELIELVQDQVTRSYAPTQQARGRLLTLVQEMASEQEPDTAGLLTGRTWRIASVAISGLGGVVARPLVRQLEDLLGMRHGESQAGPLRADVRLHGVRSHPEPG